MAAKSLIIFRHGETDWNLIRRLQGHTNIPLNENGRRQAILLRERLQSFKLETMLTSDLARAQETAEIILGLSATPVYISPHLRECRLGDAEGMIQDRLIELYGEADWAKWVSVKPEDLEFRFPNGESKSEQLKRMTDYLEGFIASNPHVRSIGISTHGGSLRRLVHHCQNAPATPVPLPNCAAYKLRFDAGAWEYVGAIE